MLPALSPAPPETLHRGVPAGLRKQVPSLKRPAPVKGPVARCLSLAERWAFSSAATATEAP